MTEAQIYLLTCSAIDTLRVVNQQKNGPEIDDIIRQLNSIALEYNIANERQAG